MIKRILFLFAFFCIISSVYSVTTISSLPYTISSSGDYDLSGDLTTTTDGIIINAQNVNLNCLGYSISKTTAADWGENGLETGGDSYDYINVSNCNFRNFYYGFNPNSADNFIVNNLSIYNSSSIALLTTNSHNNIFNNITIINASYGLYLQYSTYVNLSNILILNNNSASSITIYDNVQYYNFTNISFNSAFQMNSGSFISFNFNNVSDGNGKYVMGFTSSVNIDSWTNVSHIYLYNADNSNIQNITFTQGNGYNTYIYMYNVDNSNFSYLNYTNGYSAIILRSSSNNRFSNIYAHSNAYAAFDFVSISSNNYFYNSTLYNNTYDLISYNYAILTNISDNLGKYIIQCVDTPLNINGWTNISKIVMSNCDYSNIQNLNSIGQFRKDTFIYSINTDYSNFTNLNISNYSYGIILSTNQNNLISNLIVYNNSNYGLSLGTLQNSILTNITLYSNSRGMHAAFGGNNTIDNLTSYYNTDMGFSLGSCNSNRFSNFNIYNNTGAGFDIQSQYNTFTNFTTYYNNWGFSAGSNNNYSNFITRYNTIGVYFFGGSNSRFNNFTSYNNTGYGILVYFNSDSNHFTNFTLINNTDGIRLETSSNYNSFSNFNTSYNTQHGIILADSSTNDNNFSNFNTFKNTQKGVYITSSYNNFNNFTTYNNTDSGIYLYGGSNYNVITNFSTYFNLQGIELNWNNAGNNFSNFNSYKNTQSGIVLNSNSNKNKLYNFNSYNNTLNGIYLTTNLNSEIYNFTTYNNVQYGIDISTNSHNNTFFNGTIFNHSNYYVFIQGNSRNNTLYNNHLGNVSKIYSNNWSNVNYFNSSLSGYNVGNYWNDLGTCLSYQTLGRYKVCTNPANYTLNSSNNIYDFAPLIIRPEYIFPTPENQSTYGGNNFTIRIEDTQDSSSWFNVIINGDSYSLTNISNTQWEYTFSENIVTITNVTFNVTYSENGIMETRTFTFYPNHSRQMLSFHTYLSGIITIILILIGGFFWNKKQKTKRGNRK